MSQAEHITKWPFQSKQSWMESAASENPGMDVMSLIKTNEDHVPVDPFSFYSDFNSFGHLRLPGSKPENWKPGIEIGNENLSQAIKFTQIALENGVEYIHFNFTKNISLIDIKSLLQGVYLNMIFSRWTLPGSSKDNLDIFGYINRVGDQSKILVTSDFLNPGSLVKPSADFSFEIYSADDWISKIIDIINFMAIHPANEKPVLLSIKFSNRFLKNIACVRALKAILLKIISLYQFKQQFVIEAYLDPDHSLNDPYKNMIPLSSMSLAASLAGCDFMVPSKANYESCEKPDQWLISAIHEQHIIKQEARINGLTDPLSGSYFIDKLTRDYAAQLWKGLQTKLKNDQ